MSGADLSGGTFEGEDEDGFDFRGWDGIKQDQQQQAPPPPPPPVQQAPPPPNPAHFEAARQYGLRGMGAAEAQGPDLKTLAIGGVIGGIAVYFGVKLYNDWDSYGDEKVTVEEAEYEEV